MRILFFGDIVGKPGRAIFSEVMPRLKQKFKADFVIANGENATHGFGITPNIADSFFELGVDVITGGNHSWDRPEILGYMQTQPALLRPQNFPDHQPGLGHHLKLTDDGRRVLVINVMGRLFMEHCDDPFAAVGKLLPISAPIEAGLDAVIVDIHAEATAEKYCMGHFCDGRASLVVGTHSHVPTADHHILAHGTAYQTDAGMCGDYDSSIGMEKTATVDRMLGKVPKPRLSPATGEATLCGLFVETDPATGLALNIEPIRVGGKLSQTQPAI